jgi:hypothetical protein
MKRAEINFILNALLLLILSTISGIGFLMEYTLIPGSERRAVYGSNVDLYFWGLDRHEWGDIHLILGYIFIVLSLLHIALHWKAVVHAFHRFFKLKPLRLIIALLLILICVLIIALPLVLKPEVVKGGSHGGEHTSAETYTYNNAVTIFN